MARLEENWLTEGLIDFEYKKYILLAYLKYVQENFGHKKLYPFLSDLIYHYNNLEKIKGEKRLIVDQFPKRLVKADFKNLDMVYEQLVHDDELMKAIEEIVEFALERIKVTMEEGRSIFELVEEHLKIESIGIRPLYNKEGYFLISIGQKSMEVHIFKYTLTVFKSASEKYRSIKSEYIETRRKRLVETFEQIKNHLIARNRDMPNPATYLISSEVSLPMKETILPVSKRLLMRHLSAA